MYIILHYQHSSNQCTAYNTSMLTYVDTYYTSLSAYSVNICSVYNASMLAYVDTYNTSVSA